MMSCLSASRALIRGRSQMQQCQWLCHPFFHRFYPKKTIYKRRLAGYLLVFNTSDESSAINV
jgi:hypothetical protein